MPDSSFLIAAFATLFVVINPPGLVPLFIALTRGRDATYRRALAQRACLIAAGILTLFGLFGEDLLAFIGISIPAFRIAGGILLFLTALDMLFEQRTQERDGRDIGAGADPSVFPLATPLIAGPGAIATMILLMGQAGDDWSQRLEIFGLLYGVILATFLAFLLSAALERLLGKTGTVVITRLLGMLLAALAVQFVIDGVRGTGLIG